MIPNNFCSDIIIQGSARVIGSSQKESSYDHMESVSRPVSYANYQINRFGPFLVKKADRMRSLYIISQRSHERQNFTIFK